MSDTEKQVEKVEEQKNVVTANAAPSEPTKLKNDAEDLGPAVVKPTDNTPDNAKKVKKVSDQVNKDANDGSLPNDQKPSSMKKEETEEVEEMANMNAMKMKKMNAMKKMEDDSEKEDDKKEMMMKDKMKKESAEEVEIDLSDDVKALVSSDADLSEEFKDKAATIFETAVKTRIKEQTKILEAQYEEKLESEKETIKEAMT